MKYQKLYPQDWVDRHPYKHADDVDKYYANVANKVSKIISESQFITMR